MVTASPNADATMPNSSWISPSRQPRSVVTCPMSAHQNTKNVTLLSTMNTTWTANAPRRASVALTLVAISARVNERFLATIDRQPRCRATEDPDHPQGGNDTPAREAPGQRSGRHQVGSEHERRRRRQQRRKRREPRLPLDERRIQLERQHQAAEDEHQLLPHPVHRCDILHPEREQPDAEIKRGDQRARRESKRDDDE